MNSRIDAGDDEEQWSEAEIRHFMEEAIPFNRLLNMELVALRPQTVLRIPFVDALVGDAQLPALHGGVISTLLDTVCGAAAFASIPRGYRVSTIDLGVDYVRPALLRDLIGKAWVVRSGNRVILSHGEVFTAGDEENALATGRAVYSVHRPR